jgi:hypothetical protein
MNRVEELKRRILLKNQMIELMKSEVARMEKMLKVEMEAHESQN